MKKAVAVKNSGGKIEAVYFIDDKDLVSEENTFTRDEWSRGVSKWAWQVEVSDKLGIEYEVIGNEIEDIGNGFVYRVFFVKKDKFSRRHANDIIEEYMKKWELEKE